MNLTNGATCANVPLVLQDPASLAPEARAQRRASLGRSHRAVGVDPRYLQLPEGQHLWFVHVVLDLAVHAGCLGFTKHLYEYALGTARLKGIAKDSKFPFVATNVTEGKKEIFPASLIVNKGALKVAILGIVSPKGKFPKGVEVENPKAAVTRALAAVKGKADLVVLMSQLSIGENEALAVHFPEVAVLVSGDPGFSGEEPLWIKGKTLVVDTHVQGYLLGRLDLDLNFPFQGFYSRTIVEKNQKQLAAWEGQLKKNPENKIAAEMVKRMKADDPLEAIAGGSEYRHELIALDGTHYGEKNNVSELIKKEKERIAREARNE